MASFGAYPWTLVPTEAYDWYMTTEHDPAHLQTLAEAKIAREHPEHALYLPGDFPGDEQSLNGFFYCGWFVPSSVQADDVTTIVEAIAWFDALLQRDHDTWTPEERTSALHASRYLSARYVRTV